MAGTLSGITPTTPTERRKRFQLVPGTTRTRRCHGVFIAGDDLAIVYSARREANPKPVMLELGHGDEQELSYRMTAAQAHSMARALASAADACDSAPVVRPNKLCRWGHDAQVKCPDCIDHQAAGPHEASEGIPHALPGVWREEGGLDGLVRLDTIPATTPGMVVVAKASEDWQRQPHLRWQTWPDQLTPSTGGKEGAL